MSVKELFEKHEAEHGKFERVENKRSPFKDVHAMLLLGELFKPKGDDNKIISNYYDYHLYLNIDAEEVEKLTENQVIELVRCGVCCDSEPYLYFYGVG